MHELVIDLKDLKQGDRVLGSDGRWHDINILPQHKPKRMFQLETTSGNVKCSDNHEWTLVDHIGTSFTVSTEEIFKMKEKVFGTFVGVVDGPKLIGIKKIKPEASMCVAVVDSDDLLFEIMTDSADPVFTHNCAQRMVCGRLDSIASRMALGDNQATSIDGTHPGAGMIKAQGAVTNIQYYYEEIEWIHKWHQMRGFTPKGWEPHEDPEAPMNPDEIDLGVDEDFSITKKKTVIEFHNQRAEIDNTRDQRFEEI